MKKPLSNYLLNNFDLSAGEVGAIVSYFNPLSLHSGNHFLEKDKVSDSIVFIVEGVMRTYWLDENADEVTNFFFSENQFLMNLKSYSTEKPSTFNIQAVTPCQLLVIKKADSEKLIKEIPTWSDILQQEIQRTLLKKVMLQSKFKASTAKQKYDYFVENNKDIALRVPLQYVASFLGIAPQSLSRIRRNLD